MPAADLGAKRVAIWGLGREGRAAIAFLRQRHPALPLLLLDDSGDTRPPDGYGGNIACAFGPARIAAALDDIDVIVKSPGVSLYRPEIQAALDNGVMVTSLLNLWFAERHDITTICITGTKGKSTTASLLARILARLGRRVALAGNIGIPITAIDSAAAAYAVVEVSSYQAADFDGVCDVAVLTSLYPEHLDWHRSIENYYRDKIHLLHRSRCRVINGDTADALGLDLPSPAYRFNDKTGVHACGSEIYDGAERIGPMTNPYLARPHNLSDLCAALAAAKALGIGVVEALDAARGFPGLPHRQQELGRIGGILYVDDSISTIPELTIAALRVYADREITVIVGGYDRGIDYGRLVEAFAAGMAKAVICLGASGDRIYRAAQSAAAGRADFPCTLYRAPSMADAIACAERATPAGGVVLLSPAASSYGHYRDFIERGQDFAAKAGFSASSAGNGL